MNYNNVLFINDSNIIYQKNNEYYILELSSNIIAFGVIQDYELFIKKFESFLKKQKLLSFWSKKRLKIIHNPFYHKEDIKTLYNVFKDLNYQEIILCKEESILKRSYKNAYIFDGKVIRLYYIDKYNKVNHLYLDKRQLNLSEIKKLIFSRCEQKDLFVIGEDIEKYLDARINYYIYDNFVRFLEKNNIR